MSKSSVFTTVAIALGIAGAAAIAPLAIADSGDRSGAPSPRAELNIGEVYQRLSDAGYTRIREIELDDGKYEVEAIDRDGREVELGVDVRTGQVLGTEYDD